MASPAQADPVPAPPYFVGKVDAMVIGVEYTDDQLRGMLPASVQVVPGRKGQFVLYSGADSYGLSNYSSAFVAVDIDGFDTPSGGKARWMLDGIYGPAGVPEALSKYLNYPVREGATRLEYQGQKIRGSVTVGGTEIMM